MKLQPDHRPTPYLNRRDQYRLLTLLGLLCVMMVAIKWAAQPSSWHWLVPPERQSAGDIPELKEIDFRVKAQDQSALPPDAFRIVELDEQGEDGPEGSEAPSTEVDVPADLLSPIEDNTVGLRRKELPAYELMLSRVDELTEHEATEAAQDDVAFTVLMLQSENYRGKLITVRGDLRRLTEFPAPKDSGFDILYEGWLFTRDSGTNPYRIVFTQRPVDVPLSESINPPVQVAVTGYFFKRYGYASQGGQHVAPLLIAKNPRIIPTVSPVPGDGSELQRIMLTAIGVIVFAVMCLGIWFYQSDRRFRRSRLSKIASERLDASAEDLQALQQLSTIDTDRPFADNEIEPQQSVN
ncbi:MAG: hypothetical protein R3B91_06230 [Planctomycetaceae bacterium]